MNTKEINFAYKVRHALNENVDNLPLSIAERLSSARKIALSRKKSVSPLRALISRQVLAGHATQIFGDPLSWLGRAGIAASLVIGIMLFGGLYQFEQQERISDIADLDMAVLIDDLPLTAYVDQGFNAYLNSKTQ